MERVLLIDDDDNLRKAIGKVLANEGYTVFQAAGAWQGLVALESAEADLIIVDALMPSMDGATFLGILRHDRRRGNIPAIVISGSGKERAMAGMNGHPVEHFLEKTEAEFPRKLLAMARAILDQRADQANNPEP